MKTAQTEIITALNWVWIIISSISLAVLISAKFLDASFFSLTGSCSAKLNGGQCVLCGMTRAFIKISSFDFAGAKMLNPYSVLLYSLILVNILFCYTCILIRSINFKKH